MADSLARQVAVLTKKLKAVSEQDVKRAANTALNKSAKRINTRVASAVAKAEKIPVKLIKQKSFVRPSKISTGSAVYKIYRTSIPVVSLLSKGVIQKRMGTGTNKTGVTARGRKFKSAFINRSAGKAPQVYQRQGVARYPLITQKINIKDSIDRIAPQVARSIMKNDYQDILRQELNYRLQKRLGNA